MKNILILFSLLFIISCTQEDIEDTIPTEIIDNTITDKVVNQVAISAIERFESSNLKSTPIKSPKEIIKIKGQKGDENLFAVIYEPSGFAIISGIEDEMPILGYSSNDQYKELVNSNPAFEWWLNKTNAYIDTLRFSDTITTERKKAANDAWDQYKTSSKLKSTSSDVTFVHDIIKAEPMLTTRWGQGNPYNSKLPLQSGNCSPAAGCGTIAIAQVMRYWEYPISYNWNLMPNNLYSSSDVLEIDETANFIDDCADKLDMGWLNFGCNQSWCFPSKLDNALQDFGYSNDATRDPISGHLLDVRNDLENGRPVIADAATDAFALINLNYKNWHIFILDGYREQKFLIKITIPHTGDQVIRPHYYYYYSINWGWYGSNGSQTPDYTGSATNPSNNGNGWFSLNGISYDENLKVVTGIHPPGQ